MGDVAAIEHAFETHLFHGGIRGGAGCDEVIAYCAYREYPTTGGDGLAVGIQCGAGMEDLYVRTEIGIRALDHVAGAHLAWIAASGEDDAERGPCIPLGAHGGDVALQ